MEILSKKGNVSSDNTNLFLDHVSHAESVFMLGAINDGGGEIS